MTPDRDTACPHAISPVTSGSGGPPAGTDLAELVSHLYLCEGLSTYRIGAVTGIDRQRVGRMLARVGVPVKPKGAGRRRPVDEDRAARDEAVERLYAESGLSSRDVSAITGIPERTVRDRLRARGVRMRTKGRLNREDRVAVPVDALIRLYVSGGLSAADTGRLLRVSGQIVLRAAHDEGLPVRVGGPEPSHGPGEIELVEALYADPLVRQALARHHIARRRPAARSGSGSRSRSRSRSARNWPKNCTLPAGSGCGTSSCSLGSPRRPYSGCWGPRESHDGPPAAGRRSCAGGEPGCD